jgi:hypothetical protein
LKLFSRVFLYKFKLLIDEIGELRVNWRETWILNWFTNLDDWVTLATKMPIIKITINNLIII